MFSRFPSIYLYIPKVLIILSFWPNLSIESNIISTPLTSQPQLPIYKYINTTFFFKLKNSHPNGLLEFIDIYSMLTSDTFDKNLILEAIMIHFHTYDRTPQLNIYVLYTSMFAIISRFSFSHNFHIINLRKCLLKISPTTTSNIV